MNATTNNVTTAAASVLTRQVTSSPITARPRITPHQHDEHEGRAETEHMTTEFIVYLVAVVGVLIASAVVDGNGKW